VLAHRAPLVLVQAAGLVQNLVGDRHLPDVVQQGAHAHLLEISERILRAIPGYGAVARIVRHEHERFDGSGYPDALRGDDRRSLLQTRHG